MKRIHYSKYTGDDLGIGAEELLNALSDFLLESGFNTQYMPFSEYNQHTLEDLKKAIQEALEQGKLFNNDALQEMMERIRNMTPEQMDQLLERLVQKMADDGQITIEEPSEQPAAGRGEGRESKVKFEVTDKSLDFLGFKTLKDLLGSLGKSSFGRHDTRDLATGIEASGSAKQYEFGDTLNLNVSETLFSAIRREGARVPLDLEYSDLYVHQCEYQSSCATVLMLDCSHSMILYGEDRFTPAKKVALALTHLIRTQFPGDTIKVVLFHDSAEEIPLAALANAQVGPYHTNTAEGLKLARRLLLAQKKDMRQIIMITDGKPSALTMPDGRTYVNSMGLDPQILKATYREVSNCRRAGIMINTFMLARDRSLVEFVKHVAELCRGKAYFTNTMTLGQFILMDFMKRKTRTVR
ncbi:MAG TPA: VWA domain-containing protein [Gemmatimonadales bacterium]|nr:VWA domain-containing protein [Gemmatimonadales bacterium]